MNNTVIISSQDNFIDSIAGMLDISSRDLSNQAVIFPGKRPAHFLRKNISEKLGSSFIPPNIYSIDGFIEYLASEKLGLKSRVIESLDAAAILFNIHGKLKERIGGDNFVSLDHFIPLGIKLFGELEELMLADIDAKRLKSFVEGIPYGKCNLIGMYFEQFYAELRARNFISRAMQYLAVAQQIPAIGLSEYSRIIIGGFFAPTPVEKRIFVEFRNRPNAFFIYQRVSETDNIDGKIKEDSPKDRTEAKIQIIKTSDTHGQVFALSSLLREMEKRNEKLDEKCAIVLPAAETLFPLLNETLNGLPDTSYNIALGYPLIRTPIFSFLSLLTELAAEIVDGKLPASSYLKFMLHPYTKNIKYNGKSEATRVLIHTIEKCLAKDQSKQIFRLDEIENWSEMLDDSSKSISTDSVAIKRNDVQEHLISIHNNTIRLFDKIESIGAFAATCIEALTFIYENSTANLHPLFRQYAVRMIEVLESIQSSLINEAHFEEKNSYAKLLTQYVAEQNIPFSGTPLKGIQVLGLLETRNLKFDKVFLLDVNEGVLPPGRAEDMLLPQPLRQTLGMETYHEREKLVEHYFDLLVQGAKEVCILFSESSSASKERSRFVQKLIWKKEKQKGKLLSDDIIASVHYNMRLTNSNPSSISKSEEVTKVLNQMEFNATRLDAYLKCPLRFYYEYVLCLSEKATIAEEPDQSDIGKIVHSVLNKLFAPFLGHALLKQDIQNAAVEQIVEQEFYLKYGNDLTSIQKLMHLQVKRRIESFITYYQIPILDSKEVVITGLEKDLQSVDNNTILRARCDRIERRGDKVFILDYKTSGSDEHYKINWNKLTIDDRNTWNKYIGSLQLPFYWVVYALNQNEPAANIVPEYLLLGKHKIDEEIEAGLFEESDLIEEKFLLLKEIIRTLICEIKNKAIDFVPVDDLSPVCPGCPFTSLCGTAWIK
jgi:ATP-dependent helicase/nuclease subunit B